MIPYIDANLPSYADRGSPGQWNLTTTIRAINVALPPENAGLLMKPGILLFILALLIMVPFRPTGSVAFLPNARAELSATNPEFTFQANINGWNASQPSGTNPTIISTALFASQILTANAYVVDSAVHSLAYYQPGTLPSQVSVFDTCASANTCLASVSVTPSSPGNLQFAFPSAKTFELYCQHHPFSMHAKVFVYNSPDINGDHTVNIVDLVSVAIVFGTNSTSSSFNAKADQNRDNLVNILDLVLVAKNFGRNL